MTDSLPMALAFFAVNLLGLVLALKLARRAAKIRSLWRYLLACSCGLVLLVALLGRAVVVLHLLFDPPGWTLTPGFPITFSTTNSTISVKPTDRFLQAFGPCGDPCRVTHNPGGEVFVFWMAAKNPPKRIIIDGDCNSACAFLADLIPERVCITPRASFGFHKSSIGDIAVSRSEVIRWVLDHGGFPEFESGRLNRMFWFDAMAFWQLCEPMEWRLDGPASTMSKDGVTISAGAH